jgi:RNA polymerase sigma-70 factor, ECF subfamily
MSVPEAATEDVSPALCDERVAEFTRVAEKYRSQLLSAARRFGPPDVDAEDVVQDALLRAYRSLAHFRNESRMETWIYKITQNSAREYLRRKKRRLDVPLEQSGSEGDGVFVFDPPDPAKDPEERQMYQEMQEILVREIEKLSFRCKQVFQLCIVKEIPQRAVAKRLNVGIVTVKARIFHAKKTLKRAVQSKAGRDRTMRRRCAAHPAGKQFRFIPKVNLPREPKEGR